MAIDYTDYLNAGLTIFPLHPIEGGACGCGNEDCKAAGKHPKAKNWQESEPLTAAQVAMLEDLDGLFFGNQLERGFGVLLGKSRLLVVDVDGRNGGMETAAKLQHIRDKCLFVVASGSGYGEHWYFILPDDGKTYATTLPQHPGIDFKSSGFVVGCGSEHVSGYKYEVIKGSPVDIGQAPAELLAMIERKPREQFKLDESRTVEFGELVEIVKAIKNHGRDYSRWLQVGMAIHATTDGCDEGKALWAQWTMQLDNCQPGDTDEVDAKWHSFGKSSEQVRSGTLYAFALQDGYEPSVTFTPTVEYEMPEPAASQTDIFNPPGLVGQIAAWINRRAIYPRPTLAVAAALHIVSNAASLRYRVMPLKTSLNLMTIGIAGSGSGKGKVLECMIEAQDAMGLGSATHGSFKSTQELVRNIIEHQCAHYIIDEFGPTLKKLGNAGKSGAHYLEDLTANVIQIYTEADSMHLVTGDLKREMEEREVKKIAALKNRAAPDAEIEAAERKMLAARNGIKNPLLSMFATSEPFGFNSAIDNDPDLMTGGFLSRALIFTEFDDAPDIKPDSEICHDPLPAPIKTALNNIFSAGHTSDGFRIELLGGITEIHFDAEAKLVYEQVKQYWHARAKEEQAAGANTVSLCQRGQELTAKVAGILSVEKRAIGKTEIVWAHNLVKSVTEDKITRAKTTDELGSRNQDEKSSGLLRGILRCLKNRGETGATLGVIRNENGRKKISNENVQQALDYLIEKGAVRARENISANGRKSLYYCLIKAV